MTRETPDQLANRLQREGGIDQLEENLKQYDPAKLGPKERESYHHIWGITAFRRGDRAEAFRRFKEGLASFPDSQVLLFSLGQEYEWRREIDQMLACFDRCSFPQLGGNYVMAMARYAYLWDRPAEGAKFLQSIKDAYFKLGIVDDNFLYMRRLPFFGQTWSYLVAFAWMKKDFSMADEFLVSAKARLAEYNYDALESFYRCLKANDYGLEIQRLQNELRTQDKRFPAGYQQTKLAALQALSNRDPVQVAAILDAVAFESHDFPWLSDVVLVHRARSFWVAGNSAAEKPPRDSFLAKQKLLFEPDHAANFAFLDYQETLKPLYQTHAY
jgi:hypothetical protein